MTVEERVAVLKLAIADALAIVTFALGQDSVDLRVAAFERALPIMITARVEEWEEDQGFPLNVGTRTAVPTKAMDP